MTEHETATRHGAVRGKYRPEVCGRNVISCPHRYEVLGGKIGDRHAPASLCHLVCSPQKSKTRNRRGQPPITGLLLVPSFGPDRPVCGYRKLGPRIDRIASVMNRVTG